MILFLKNKLYPDQLDLAIDDNAVEIEMPVAGSKLQAWIPRLDVLVKFPGGTTMLVPRDTMIDPTRAQVNLLEIECLQRY